MSVDAPETIVRCRNEMPYVERTLTVLQRCGAKIIVFDSGSTDGSLEVARRAGVEIVQLLPESYVPGRVLNDAMSRTKGSIVAFVNADAIPKSDDAVQQLIDACKNGAAASFGRQVPRADARPSTRMDYGRAFPEDPRGNGWHHFFSMAASAIRRDVWESLAFDPDLRFSEDIDWTFRLRALGLKITYVPSAVFEHSHDYDKRGMQNRMTGEGVADTSIFRLGKPTLRDLVLPLGAQLARDVKAGLPVIEQIVMRTISQVARIEGRRQPMVAPHNSLPSAPSKKLTLVGDPRAENAVERVIERALEVLDRELGDVSRGILLLGGYGCGEGAVDEANGTFSVHNDLDLALVVKTRREARSLRERCRHAGEEASRAAHATVDIWPVSEEELNDPRGRMLWIDSAVRGVRVLRGAADLVAPLRSLGARATATGELGRLLTNRATGLALSRLAFEMGEDESSRAARHVAKAWLAAGDTLLVNVDRYAASLQSRVSELETLARVGAPFVAMIAEGYSAAAKFRKNPTAVRVSAEQLEKQRQPLWQAFAALEMHRLAATLWADVWAYAKFSGRIFPDLPDVSEIVRHVGGLRAAAQGVIGWNMAWRHPREALARTSALLAFAEDLGTASAWAARSLHAKSAASLDVRSALERLRERAA